MKIRYTIYISILLVFCVALYQLVDKGEAINTRRCSGNPRIIFVRGSGESVSGYTYQRFKESLSQKLHAGYSEIIELEDSLVGARGATYAAVPVVGSSQAALNGSAATISAGHLGRYAASLQGGKELLVNHLVNGYDNPRQCWVLVGYSQGAHVIGEAIKDVRLQPIKDRIIYVGLFGDPKYNLWGYDLQAGHNIPWYRGNAKPAFLPGLQTGGILQARFPDYVPRNLADGDNMFTRVGSWCYDDDPVCTSNFIGGTVDGAHGKYPERAFGDMTAEIANAVADEYGPQYIAGGSCGSNRQDVVIALDVSPTMRREASLLGAGGVETTLDNLYTASCDVRVGLVTYGRDGIEAPQIIEPLTDDRTKVSAAMRSLLYEDPAADSVQGTDALGGIRTALDSAWREGAHRAIFVITDTGGTDAPQTWRGIDYEAMMRMPRVVDVIQTSRRLGGVELYGAQVPHTRELGIGRGATATDLRTYLFPLVNQTGGQLLWQHSCDFCIWGDVELGHLKEAFHNKPVISMPSITVRVGEGMPLLAQDSGGMTARRAAENGWRVYQGWYTDCGGQVDPSAVNVGDTITLRQAGTCYGAVMTTYLNGAICRICADANTGSRTLVPFKMTVLPADYQQPAVPAAPSNVRYTRDWAAGTITYAWGSSAGSQRYTIYDDDGSILGITEGTQLVVTDVDADAPVPSVGIAPVGEGGEGPVVDVAAGSDLSPPKPAADPVQPGVLTTSSAVPTAADGTSPGSTLTLAPSEVVAVLTSSGSTDTVAGSTSTVNTAAIQRTVAAKVLGDSTVASVVPVAPKTSASLAAPANRLGADPYVHPPKTGFALWAPAGWVMMLTTGSFVGVALSWQWLIPSRERV